MKKKLFSTIAVTAISISMFGAPVQAETTKVVFTDIKSLHYGERNQINYLVNKGVMLGFMDGTFRPNDEVTRDQYASFIAKALNLPMPKKPKQFKDVTA